LTPAERRDIPEPGCRTFGPTPGALLDRRLQTRVPDDDRWSSFLNLAGGSKRCSCESPATEPQEVRQPEANMPRIVMIPDPMRQSEIAHGASQGAGQGGGRRCRSGPLTARSEARPLSSLGGAGEMRATCRSCNSATPALVIWVQKLRLSFCRLVGLPAVDELFTLRDRTQSRSLPSRTSTSTTNCGHWTAGRFMILRAMSYLVGVPF